MASRSKSTMSKFKSLAAATIVPPTSFASSARRWIPIAPPPKIANHKTETTDGTSSTPVTNWRIVRPLEIRAMNMPTNGDQLIHHAQ